MSLLYGRIGLTEQRINSTDIPVSYTMLLTMDVTIYLQSILSVPTISNHSMKLLVVVLLAQATVA